MTTSGGSAEQPTSYGLQPPEASTVAATQEPAEPTPGPPSEAGRLVGGRYRLLERLGFGGMGTVWRAHDEVVDRDVAIKEPRLPEQLTDAERATAHLRMQREARAAARVDHPSVVTVHDVVTVDESPWIVMELVRGRSLSEVLAEGTVPAEEAARIGLAVVGALAVAHEAGVLHRDVKPGNILLGRHDRVVLTDFGIARVEGEQKLTETGTFIGSPEYIAPERVLGQRSGPESDLWSLGVVLYQAVEGVSPFRRQTTPSTLQAILLADLPRPTRAGALGEVLVRLLRKEPAARPTAAELAEALRSVAHPEPQGRALLLPDAVREANGAGAATPGTALPLPRRAVRAVRGSRRAQAGVGGAALVAVLALLWAVLDPFGPSLPAGWKSFEEKEVDATLAAPAGYVRSVNDTAVSFTDPTKVFGIEFFKWTGSTDTALGSANKALDWYKQGGQVNYLNTVDQADGKVTETQQQGRSAALYDVTYLDTTQDGRPKMRALDLRLIRKDGAGFELKVTMPAAGEQAAAGEQLFNDLRSHFQVHGL